MRIILVASLLFSLAHAQGIPGGVQQVQAGTNVTVTGTRSHPVISAAGGGGGTVTGTGTAPRVAFWTGASAIGSDSDLTWDQASNTLSVGGSGKLVATSALTVDSTDITIGTTTSAVHVAAGNAGFHISGVGSSEINSEADFDQAIGGNWGANVTGSMDLRSSVSINIEPDSGGGQTISIGNSGLDELAQTLRGSWMVENNLLTNNSGDLGHTLVPWSSLFVNIVQNQNNLSVSAGNDIGITSANDTTIASGHNVVITAPSNNDGRVEIESPENGIFLGDNSTNSYTMIKRNNGGSTIQNNDAHLVFENPDPDNGQTLVTFSFAGAEKGGVRSDFQGNFNWHAVGPQGHQFYGTIGTDAPGCGISATGIACGYGGGQVAAYTIDANGDIRAVGGLGINGQTPPPPCGNSSQPNDMMNCLVLHGLMQGP